MLSVSRINFTTVIPEIFCLLGLTQPTGVTRRFFLPKRDTKGPHTRFEKGYHLLPNRSNKLVDFKLSASLGLRQEAQGPVSGNWNEWLGRCCDRLAMPVALQMGVLSSLLESGRPNFDLWVGSIQSA